MTHRLLTLASALSLLLFVATALLWTWSSVRPIFLTWGNSVAAVGYTVIVANGRVSILRATRQRAIPLGPDEVMGSANYSGWSALGLMHQRFDLVKRNTRGAITGVYENCRDSSFQLAWPLLLSFPLPARVGWRYAVWAKRTRRRIREGRCTKCGYDLRASTDQCPECGARVFMSQEASA